MCFVCNEHLYILNFTEFKEITFFGSQMYHRKNRPSGVEIKIDGLDIPALIHRGGMILTGSDGQCVSITKLNYGFQIELWEEVFMFGGKVFYLKSSDNSML